MLHTLKTKVKKLSLTAVHETIWQSKILWVNIIQKQAVRSSSFDFQVSSKQHLTNKKSCKCRDSIINSSYSNVQEPAHCSYQHEGLFPLTIIMRKTKLPLPCPCLRTTCKFSFNLQDKHSITNYVMKQTCKVMSDNVYLQMIEILCWHR